MEPLGIFKLIAVIWRFAKAAPRYTSDDKELLARVPQEFHAELRSRSRGMVLLAVLGAAALAIAAPFLTIVALAKRDGTTYAEALAHHSPMFFIFPIGIYIGMFAGLSVGILFAPTWYLGSPFGEKWIELSGAETLGGARFVAALVVALGLAYPWLLYLIAGPG